MTTIAMKNLAREVLVATAPRVAFPRFFTQAEIRLLAKELMEQDDYILDLEKRIHARLPKEVAEAIIYEAKKKS